MCLPEHTNEERTWINEQLEKVDSGGKRAHEIARRFYEEQIKKEKNNDERK
jgi:hypothetical protein